MSPKSPPARGTAVINDVSSVEDAAQWTTGSEQDGRSRRLAASSCSVVTGVALRVREDRLVFVFPHFSGFRSIYLRNNCPEGVYYLLAGRGKMKNKSRCFTRLYSQLDLESFFFFIYWLIWPLSASNSSLNEKPSERLRKRKNRSLVEPLTVR